MDIFSRYGDYLSGEKLDVGRRFFDPSAPDTVDRIEYLVRVATGKRVLHLGCLDHADIIEQRIANGDWLHGNLSAAASRCLGVDIDERGRDLVRDKHAVSNVVLADLCAPLTKTTLSTIGNDWDVIVCAEMLEHVTNHQQFLTNLRSLSGPQTSLVVTVPNAFSFSNFVNALRGFESINSDHKYWFTFYTLSRLLAATGWRPARLVYYRGSRKNWLHKLSHHAAKISRTFCPGLIIEASPMGTD